MVISIFNLKPGNNQMNLREAKFLKMFRQEN